MNRLILLLLLLPAQAYAVVDLISPEDGLVTQQQTHTFDYYASVPGLQGCTLSIGSQQFPDTDAQSNAMNSVQVQNIAPGTYGWNVTCTGNATEWSIPRTLTIDTEQPTLVFISPSEGTTDTLAVDFIPNDETAAELACSVSWLGQPLDTVTVSANTHHVETYAAQPGTGNLTVVCADEAGNSATQSRALTLEPAFFFTMTIGRETYGIGEPVELTADTLPGANVAIDVCPNTGGFVQCTSAIMNPGEFPQTITLPTLNKTGSYLIDGVATFDSEVINRQLTYTVENTIQVDVRQENVGQNTSITLTANVDGGSPPYSIAWLLTNSTVRTGSQTDVRYPDPGEYNLSVSVTDAAGNKAARNVTVSIEPIHELTLIIVDNTSNQPIEGALIDFEGEEWTTLYDGLAEFDVESGKYTVFVTAAGYDYHVDEYVINTSKTITIRLVPLSGNPSVLILSPQQNGTSGIPPVIKYKVEHTEPVTCTLLKSSDSNWFVEEQSQEVSDGGQKAFQTDYGEGTHAIRIECVDADARSGSSPPVTFIASPEVPAETVETEAETFAEDAFLQDVKELVQSRMEASYGKDEQDIIALIGFDGDLRKLNKLVLQAIRDMDDLRHRDGIDKDAERQAILARVNTALGETPISFTLRDDKKYVKYVEKEDVEEVLATLSQLDAFADVKAKQVLDDQQKFTVDSRVYHIELTHYDGSTKSSTVVARSFTYADELSKQYRIVEIIPKKVAKSAEDIRMVTSGTILIDDPVLEFPAGKNLVYLVPGEVPFHEIEGSHTLLAGTYASAGITGMAILTSGEFAGLTWPILIAIALIVLGFAAHRLNLLQQLTYIMYRMRKHEKVHYVRVVINDTEDMLGTQQYEKAEMLYKEVRMTYDTLPEMERNDLYDDVMGLVRKMDKYYFNTVMMAIDKHIKAGDMHSAIDEYEKLIGTFDRLESEDQQQLVETVGGLAKRLGVAA